MHTACRGFRDGSGSPTGCRAKRLFSKDRCIQPKGVVETLRRSWSTASKASLGPEAEELSQATTRSSSSSAAGRLRKCAVVTGLDNFRSYVMPALEDSLKYPAVGQANVFHTYKVHLRVEVLLARPVGHESKRVQVQIGALNGDRLPAREVLDEQFRHLRVGLVNEKLISLPSLTSKMTAGLFTELGNGIFHPPACRAEGIQNLLAVLLSHRVHQLDHRRVSLPALAP